jgi:hypothetical protein
MDDGPESVVIGDFNAACVAVVPNKTDPILVVDPDAMLSDPITFQRLKPITGQGEISQCPRVVDRPQLPACHTGDVLKLADRFTTKDRLRLFVAKTLDHG